MITILEKYGYLDRSTHFKENEDSLIGCVVWRRNQLNSIQKSSRKSDHTQVWSPIRTPSKSSRKNDPTVWSPIRTSSESSRKNDPIVWSPIRTPSETSRKIDSSPVWSPIRWPLESSTKSDQDISKQRDGVERDKNGSITSQPNLSLRTYYYSDLVKSEDTPNNRQVVSSAVETSNIDLSSKDVGRELVPLVTAVTKQSLPSAILHNELEDDLPEYEFRTLLKRKLDDGTKQSLSSVIIQKELEDDLPEFDFGTLTTSCQIVEKRKWEENMEHDMDISPEQSPQKKVCRIDENSNMSSSTTLFAAAPPMSPVNASWYPSVQYMNQLNAKVSQEASNIPHFTYLGSVSNSMQQNFIPSPSALQIHPPFQTLKPDFTYLGSVSNSMQQNFIPSPSALQIHPPFQTLIPDFTYLGPTFTRGYAEALPQPHAHSHGHAKPRRNDVRIGRDHMTEFNQHFTFKPQKAANKQYQVFKI